jgi:hypothetical protein
VASPILYKGLHRLALRYRTEVMRNLGELPFHALR